jgi:3-deoxy-D-manno-octulosonic-acid transferase
VAAWPLDFPGVTRRAVERRAPRRLLVVETEIWPNLLSACLERGVRVAFANARLSERRWTTTRLLAPLVAPLLGRVSACAAQTEGDFARWAQLGVPREALAVTGNTKYDHLGPAPEEAARRAARARAGLPAEAFVAAWGSLRPGEEEALAALVAALRAAGSPLCVVAVPRHPERAPLQARELERRGVRVVEWRPGAPWPAAPPGSVAIAWVPALGVLRDVYGVADAAIVGGTFAPFGGHNAAEPAGLGLPVLVGPHHSGVREVIASLSAVGGGRVCVDGRELADALERWRREPEAHAKSRRAARRAIEDLGGASARTIGFLEARGFWG